MTGFEPATSWSQTKRSSQAELHPAEVRRSLGVVARSVNERFHVKPFRSRGTTHDSQHTLEVVVRAKRDHDLAGLFAAKFDLDRDTQQVSQLALQ